jgi:hypothetical protein
MSYPTSESARQQRVDRASVPPVDLFSHPPKAEPVKQHRPFVHAGSDWRAAPFAVETAEQRRSVAVDDEDQPAAAGVQRRAGRR